MIALHVVMANGETLDYDVETESVVIGRSSKCDVVLPDASLSRQHARLSRSGDVWVVEDLGSRNGTYVNGDLVSEPASVGGGDVIGVSANVISVVDHAASPSSDERAIFRSATDVLETSGKITAPVALEGEEALRRYAERLQILNEVHDALGRSITLEELLDLILDRAFDHLQPEQGVILLRGADQQLYQAASRSVRGHSTDFHTSKHLVSEVAEKEQAALVLDARTDVRFAGAPSIIGAGVRSLVAAPLLGAQGASGMIALSSTAAVRQFTEEDMELLVCLASVAAMRIRNVALAEEAAERQRMQRELALARRIQVALLQDEIPVPPGYQVYVDNLPSQTVSGDFYQVVERKQGAEYVLMIADVSGKGIAASLLTSYIEALSAAPIEDGRDPAEICTALSHRLHSRTPPEKYATAIIAVLETGSGTVRYVNAGHNSGLVVRGSGTVDPLTATGFPLGLIALTDYHCESMTLEPGDLLVLHTDGLTEAVGPDDEEYGAERMAAACLRHRDNDLPAFAAGIERDLQEFVRGTPFADDRTLVIVRRIAGGASGS